MSLRMFAAGLAGAVTLALATPALAAPACKGQDKSACGANAACTWIDAYTTQSGSKVNAYCFFNDAETTEKSGAANAKAKSDAETRSQRSPSAAKGNKGTS